MAHSSNGKFCSDQNLIWSNSFRLLCKCICVTAVDKQILPLLYLQIPFSANSGYPCTVAIDFGTTFSGYAYYLRASHNISIPTWIAGNMELSYKTPTTVLLDNKTNFVDFGYDAEKRYVDLCGDDEHENYYYFHRFKMMLYDKIRTEVRICTSISKWKIEQIM